MSFTLPRVFRLENNKNNLEKIKSFFFISPHFCCVHLPLALLAADQAKAVFAVCGRCFNGTVKKRWEKAVAAWQQTVPGLSRGMVMGRGDIEGCWTTYGEKVGFGK